MFITFTCSFTHILLLLFGCKDTYLLLQLQYAIAETLTAIVAVYTIDGKQTDRLSTGLNIVRYADGTVKKVMK